MRRLLRILGVVLFISLLLNIAASSEIEGSVNVKINGKSFFYDIQVGKFVSIESHRHDDVKVSVGMQVEKGAVFDFYTDLTNPTFTVSPDAEILEKSPNSISIRAKERKINVDVTGTVPSEASTILGILAEGGPRAIFLIFSRPSEVNEKVVKIIIELKDRIERSSLPETRKEVYTSKVEALEILSRYDAEAVIKKITEVREELEREISECNSAKTVLNSSKAHYEVIKEKLPENERRRAENLLRSAEEEFKAGNFDKARSYAEKLLGIHPPVIPLEWIGYSVILAVVIIGIAIARKRGRFKRWFGEREKASKEPESPSVEYGRL